MNNLNRTTITIPEKIHRQARVQAASQNKSLSRYISDLLEIYALEDTRPELVLGTYKLNIQKPIKRDVIYGDYLKRKVSG